MPTRTADAVWQGNLTEGKGEIKLGSGAFQGAYDWRSRSADGPGTNPEELIAAAHAGCFSMALSHQLAEAGHPRPRFIQPRKSGSIRSKADLPSRGSTWIAKRLCRASMPKPSRSLRRAQKPAARSPRR